MNNPESIDKNKKIVEIAKDISFPSEMVIIDKDILITQKYDGKIKLVRDFDMKKYPIYKVESFLNETSSGLMGIASKKDSNKTLVFLYLKSKDKQGSVFSNPELKDKIYQYVWNSSGLSLDSQKLIMDIPINGISNGSGDIQIGNDNQIYIASGHEGLSALPPNYKKISNKNLSIDSLNDIVLVKNGGIENKNPISTLYKLHNYKIYLINDASKIATDPFTGYLWKIRYLPNLYTALTFINKSEINSNDNGSLFLGDKNGNLFRFGLDKNRENIIYSANESKSLFAKGFGPIIDLKYDNKGTLYVLSLTNSTLSYDKQKGTLYAISLKNNLNILTTNQIINYDYMGIIWIFIIILALLTTLNYKRIKHILKI